MTVYLLYLLFIVAPICTLIHEGGHAIGAILVKADKIHLTIGAGKKIWEMRYKNFRFSVRKIFFFSGMTKNERAKAYSHIEIAIISISGPLNNIVFAILFYLAYNTDTYVNDFLLLLCLFNVWLAFTNLLPFKLRDKQSDGYVMIQALIKKK